MASQSVIEIICPESEDFESIPNTTAIEAEAGNVVVLPTPEAFAMWFNNVWEMDCYRRETVTYTDPAFSFNNSDEELTITHFRTSINDPSVRWERDYPPPSGVVDTTGIVDVVEPIGLSGQTHFSYDPEDVPDGAVFVPLAFGAFVNFYIKAGELRAVFYTLTQLNFPADETTLIHATVTPTEVSLKTEVRYPFGVGYEAIFTSEWRCTVTRQFY